MEIEDTETFFNRSLHHDSFAFFEDMRGKGHLCDFATKVQNCTFSAHRVVLAAGIPYFRAIFTSREQDTKQEEISVGELNPEAFGSLIDYAYTGKVTISKENAQSLLVASQILQVNEVECACVQFLSERLCMDNIAQVFTFARTVNNSKLTENCKSFIEQNFEEFSKCEGFLSLPYESIDEIISKCDLNFTDGTVCVALMRWGRVSLPERLPFVTDMLKKVGVDLSPIFSVGSLSPLATEEPSSSGLHGRKTKQIDQDVGASSTKKYDFGNKLYAVCVRRNKDQYLYCSFYSHVEETTWNKLASKKVVDPTLAAVSASNIIYVFFEKTIEKFDPKTLEWERINVKTENFICSCIVAHGNFIYCFGSMGENFITKVRCFDTRRTEWLTEREMKNPRWDIAGVSLDGFIYLTGGMNITLRPTSMAEKYNPATDNWIQIASMFTPRRGHACAVLNKKIYVCGGRYTMADPTNECEVYDPATNHWNRIAYMNVERYRFSVVSNESNLYAFGGNEPEPTCGSEVYDPVDDTWKSTFCLPPEGFKAAVLMCNGLS